MRPWRGEGAMIWPSAFIAACFKGAQPGRS